jgi:hypothetical protein
MVYRKIGWIYLHTPKGRGLEVVEEKGVGGEESEMNHSPLPLPMFQVRGERG